MGDPRPIVSWPPGSGWTGKHWSMAAIAGTLEGAAAWAEVFPHAAGWCHIVQAVLVAVFFQLGLTSNSVRSVRLEERRKESLRP